jgi:homoserine O-acetyltransferase/O-succinyltransferase
MGDAVMARHMAASLITILFAIISVSQAQSDDLIVTKKVFELPTYTTVAGETIKSVKIGWEAAGVLNADRSNAILITHYFSGTSHAFGKYATDDQVAGYWDAIIGPGKVIDTNKYYVLSSDTLVNLNAKMPNVVTTGPASINPDTDKPYGMSFPVVSIKDFVRVQKALIDSLGIKKLKAVIGASMGGLQAYEWAQSYPDSVDRIISAVASASADPYLIAWLDMWAQPIRLDPKWNNGNYYDKEPPIEGLKAALKIVTLQANGWEWARKTFGTAPAQESKDPAKALANEFKIEAFLDQTATARAAVADANHFLYLCRANQLASVDPANIKVPTLVLYAPNDLVFYEPIVQETIQRIAAAGTYIESGTLAGPNGHLNALTHIDQQADRITEFLSK